MKKIILFFILMSSAIFANQVSQNIVKGSAYGKDVVDENNMKIDQERAQKADPYTREIIYNLYLQRSSQERPGANAKDNIKMVREQNLTTPPSQTPTLSDSNVTITGYCLIQDSINVGKQRSSVTTLCNTDKGQIRLFSDLTPVNKESSLIPDPIYVEKNGRKFKVLSSRVLNEARTSYNIATYVNDRKIDEILLSSTSVAADEIKTSSNEYLAALEKSRTKQTVSYVDTGTGAAAVSASNTEAPNAFDYIAKGIINVGAATAKTAAEIFKKDLTALYYVEKNTKMYVELTVANEEMQSVVTKSSKNEEKK